MARNLITVSQVVNDFILTLEGDDYANNASDTLIHNYALRGIREMGFDLLQRVRSLKLSTTTNDTVELPDDFVDLVKIGIVDTDGLIHVFGENKNMNYSQKYKTDTAGNRLDSDGDGVFDREDSKSGQSTRGLFGGDDIYYRLIERKSSVPMAEKNRARAEYYNERRKANARLKAFSKEEALKTIRKNFKQSPKF